MASSGTSVFDVVSWVFDMDVTLHKQQASTRLGLANSLKPVVDVFVCFTYSRVRCPVTYVMMYGQYLLLFEGFACMTFWLVVVQVVMMLGIPTLFNLLLDSRGRQQADATVRAKH